MQMTDPHARPAADCLADLNATADGLTTAEATQRLAAHGPNRLPEIIQGVEFRDGIKHESKAL